MTVEKFTVLTMVLLSLDLILALLCCFLFIHYNGAQTAGAAPPGRRGRSFAVNNTTFLLDGRPFHYVAGAMHYFKVPRALWQDRLTRVRAAGVSVLQTYVQWSVHQPDEEAPADFTGQQDIEHYIALAQRLGLLVILRPGPYIDAEQDLGGLPYWLLRRPGIKLRTSDRAFMSAVAQWYDQLLPRIRRLLYVNGGPIIMVQVENEYGSYPACDRVYTAVLRDLLYRHLGNVFLYTTDGAAEAYLRCGAVPDVFATIDFGVYVNVTNAFAIQKQQNKGGPAVNSEFYPGWINHWGYPQNTVATKGVVETARNMIAANASFTVYMMHGGTSFGYLAGGSTGDTAYVFKPLTTSYDFDAPITESGNTTDKYVQLREVIYPYTNQERHAIPPPLPVTAYGEVKMKWQTSVLEAVLALPVNRSSKSAVVPFCDLHQAYGFVAYSTVVGWRPTAPAVLVVGGVRDRGYVWVDDCWVGIVTRQDSITALPIMSSEGSNITILVENQGRICYGDLNDRKGLLEEVTLAGHQLTNWTIRVVPQQLTALVPTVATAYEARQPGLYRGHFSVSGAPMDTFLHLPGWSKGIAFINEINLGRYWPAAGPQQSLYIPAPFLTSGDNQLTLMELDGAPCDEDELCRVEMRDYSILDGSTPLEPISRVASPIGSVY